MGCGAYICLAIEYDANAVVPLLMITFEVLNPFVHTCAIEVVGYGLIFGELSLFKRLFITPTTSVDPLT
jgi:hypothetical protein